MTKILAGILIVVGAILTYLSKKIAQFIWKETVDTADEKNIYVKLSGLVLIIIAVVITALS
ncbi:MAG: hypothetical protein E7394_00670 [Ruminococcaceae bacterium]|nr:hypothetical protein [Oscillospiraceae bacterium]